MKTMKKNQNLLENARDMSQYDLYIYNLVHSCSFMDKSLLCFNLVIHFFITLLIGALEWVSLDSIEIAIGLFILFLLIYLNFQFFSYYIKENMKLIFKHNNKNKSPRLKYTALSISVGDRKLDIFRLWVISNFKFSLIIFVIGCFYNKGLIPGIVYLSNLDPDFQLGLVLILLIVTPQVFIIGYFLYSTGFLAKFYFFIYLVILRWILIIIIILFVSEYNLELASFLLLLLSTGLLSIFWEIDIFINANIIIKTLFSNVMNYFMNNLQVIVNNSGELISCYWAGALASNKLIKFGHNSKIPFCLRKGIIDSKVNLKVKINGIVIVTTRYIPSIIEFNTKKVISSRIILEVISCHTKFGSYKLLGGASSGNSNLNSLIFPSEPLLLGNQTSPVNQTFFQYLVGGRDSGIFSDKFIDLFLTGQYRPFNRYKNLIINDEHKLILSLFAPLFIEQNNLFCFGVNMGGYLVPIPYKKIFYNDKPNLSLYKLIGIFDNEGDMIRQSDLCINQRNADHWVSGSQRNAQDNGKIWKSYCHLEELENVSTFFYNKTFRSLCVIINNRYVRYDPDLNTHERRDLYLLINGQRSKLPFESPRYFNVNTLKSLFEWKHGDKIKSFFQTSNSLRTLE